jgi:precorrin-2 dehydrogenase/sirohydrochlorin ferrochelatase
MATGPGMTGIGAAGPDPGPIEPSVDYPVVLSVSGRPCLVVGAGPVATRKARGLLECGAQVTVVAPETAEAMDALLRTTPTDRLRLERRVYRTGEVTGYDFVVAATGDEATDRLVTQEAIEAGVLVNGAPVASIRSVHLPALHRQGLVTIAVSTSGRSPALARWLRTRIAESTDQQLALLATLLADARAAIHSDDRSSADIDWSDVIDRVLPLVEQGRVDEARAVLGGLLEG